MEECFSLPHCVFFLPHPGQPQLVFPGCILPGAHNKYPKAANWILSGEKQPINIVRGGQAGDCGITTFTLLQGILYSHSAPCFSPVRQLVAFKYSIIKLKTLQFRLDVYLFILLTTKI